MADYWERLIEELVLELLEDLLERPRVWEAEAWLAGMSVEKLLAEEIVARVAPRGHPPAARPGRRGRSCVLQPWRLRSGVTSESQRA